MKLFPLPLRSTLPAILLVMGGIAGGFSYQRQVTLAHARAEEELTQHAKLTATATAQLLEYLYRRSDIQNSQSEGAALVVSRLNGDRRLNLILFCDEQNQIRNASRYDLQNQTVDNTALKELVPLLDQVRQRRSGQVAISPNHHSIRAVYPVTFPPAAGELRSNRVGAIVLDYDLAEAEQRALADAGHQSLQTIGMLTVLCVLVGILLNRIVTHRARQLVFASNQLAQGNLDVRVPLQGSDEFSQIATAFNRMAAQLQHDTAVLQASEQQFKAQTAQLETTLQELGHTQAQLIQQEKMSSLGQLVAGLAHEINNPINFIYGNLSHIQTYCEDLLTLIQLYQQHYPQPAPDIQAETEACDLEFLQADLPKILSSLKMGTDRIRQIVLSLRNFSRMDEAAFKAVDIHEGIDSTLLILHHRLKAKSDRPEIQVTRDYGPLPLVECYVGQLNQVFMNILANAIDALDDFWPTQSGTTISPTITIRTSLTEQQWVSIAIADNGPGIPQDIQNRIFDPFFTTKPVGKGTGMGMSISYQIVTEKHSGQLKCSSTPGQGSEFIIQIPIQQPGFVEG